MSEDHFSRFFPAICAGLGLLLAGAVNLVLLRRGTVVRVGATLIALSVGLGTAWALDQPGAVAGAARLIGLALIPLALLSSRSLVNGVANLTRAASRPAIRFGLLSVAGLAVAVGSIVVFETADDQASNMAIAEMELLHSQTPTVPTTQASARTDRGTPIVLNVPVNPRDEASLGEAEYQVLQRTQLDEQVIRRGRADDHANCHGWVFTGGRFQVPGAEVAVILTENGYQETADPRPGDLVVYRSEDTITHTAVVRYVAESQPILVEGKWGILGVFIHPIDQSVYGTEYTIYRSPRNGHLLVGVGGNAGAADGAVKIITAE